MLHRAAAFMLALIPAAARASDANASDPARAEPAAPATNPAAPAPVAEPSPGVIRVGGDMAAQVERRGESFFIGTASVTTPLPEGYPPPTPPGAIEVKDYPLVRRAMVTSTGGVNWGMNGAFWPLFQHIQRRDIEMTSPVEMDYKGLEPVEGDKPDQWTMSFLYRRVEQGPTGPDGKRVTVADLEPVTVLSLGYQGDYDLGTFRQQYIKLNLWLEQHEDEWERVGDPRAMYYNGPEVRGRRKWAEVQIPVRRRNHEAPAATTTAAATTPASTQPQQPPAAP